MPEGLSDPWVSIILVCHNDGRWLARCLESIWAQTISLHLEVIIADNASVDGSDQIARILIQDHRTARFLSTGGDRGFCAGTNVGAASARGLFIFVLNPDTWLEPDCVEKLFMAVRKAKAGAGGPTIQDYNTSAIQSYCPSGFDFCGNIVASAKHRSRHLPFSAGGFFFIKRELFNKLGGLDEKFFMYCEELDLSWRVLIAGETIIEVPEAIVHHRGAVGVNPAGDLQAVENRTSVQKRFLANRNRLVCLAKNCHNFLLLLLIPSAFLVFLEGCATGLMTRSFSLARKSSLESLVSFWSLRSYIRQQRTFVSSFRRRGDFWMLKFFRLQFGRWDEMVKIVKGGFPRFK
jgi:GT2 family glycosyltransferase